MTTPKRAKLTDGAGEAAVHQQPFQAPPGIATPTTTAGGGPQCEYAIVASEKTCTRWSAVITALRCKHADKRPRVVSCQSWDDPAPVVAKLRGIKPRYTAFVAHWSECTKAFVEMVHDLTTSLDEAHPFSDTIWGIVTGSTESDALAVAVESAPLAIRHVASGSVEGVQLERFVSGIAFNELKEGDHSVKTEGSPQPDHSLGHSTDSTWLIASAFEDAKTDMLVTSGHARWVPRATLVPRLSASPRSRQLTAGCKPALRRETEWNIGFRFQGGKMTPQQADGGLELHAVGKNMEARRLSSQKPKVYSAAGNCLMGHISGETCMALAWMRCMGVRQMFGYTVPTWYGYAGWGVHRYLFSNVGRMTFAEAYFASQQALLHRLSSLQPQQGSGTDPKVPVQPRAYTSNRSTESDGSVEDLYARGGGGLGRTNATDPFGEQEHHVKGLRFDRDHTVRQHLGRRVVSVSVVLVSGNRS